LILSSSVFTAACVSVISFCLAAISASNLANAASISFNFSGFNFSSD